MIKELISVVAIFILVILVWTFIKLKQNVKYWEHRGVTGPRPNIFFGNFGESYFKRFSHAEIIRNIYLSYRSHPVVGCFNMTTPILLVNEPEYIERVLKTDFSYFTDRVPSYFSQRHEIYKNLFNLNGPHWKAMRNKMAPLFTSLKLKSMMPLMENCFENTSCYIDENIGDDVDMKEVSSIFSHDVIVQCMFGIESKDLSKPGTRFRRMQTEFFNVTVTKLIYFTFIDQFPKVAEYFKLTHFSQKTVEYFQKLVEMTLNLRMSNKEHCRGDLVQILLKMREKKTLDIYDWDHSEEEMGFDSAVPLETVQVTDELLESQAMIFFHTGIESLMASLCFAVYELARNPDVLKRLTSEIDTVTSKYGLTVKALQSMSYLDQCIKETLRLYPVVPSINRVCSRRYEFPCGLAIEPGQLISIPIFGIHVDNEYFQEAHLFKPERFIDNPQPYTYLPFGEGPRICFAMKFVLTEMKVGLCKLIQRYHFSLSSRTELPLNLVKWNMFIKPSSPLWIKFTKRNRQ